MAKKDYYEILGVSKDASEADIKSAFRKKAKEYHPDVNKDPGASNKFKEIGEAYSVLSDATKRKQYDQFGSSAFDGSGGFQGFGGFSGFDFDDFDLGSIFEQFMGGGSRRGSAQARPTRGDDLLVKLNLTFEEAIFGTEKNFKVTVDEACKTCDGKGGHDKGTCSACSGRGRVVTEQRTILGVIQTETTCHACSGTGFKFKNTCETCKGKRLNRKTKTINFKVPKGVEHGDQMRMSGRGGAGLNGGPNGDIYINFSVKDHPLYKRESDDLIIEVPLTITEAVMGTTKEIPTPYGSIKHTFDSGTQSNTTIRLRGKGIKSDKTSRTGDLYIVTNVVIPSKLDRKQKSLFKDLNKTKFDNNSIFKDFEKYIEE